MKPIIKAMRDHNLQEVDSSHRMRVHGLETTISLSNLTMTVNHFPYELDKTPCHYGGYRYFIVCPDCSKRRNKLIANNLDECFICNECIGVYKYSLNRSHTDCGYYYALAKKEALKIDPSYKLDWRQVFPEKPKYMKWSKYYKHYIKFNQYCMKGDKYWISGACAIIENAEKWISLK